MKRVAELFGEDKVDEDTEAADDESNDSPIAGSSSSPDLHRR